MSSAHLPHRRRGDARPHPPLPPRAAWPIAGPLAGFEAAKMPSLSCRESSRVTQTQSSAKRACLHESMILSFSAHSLSGGDIVFPGPFRIPAPNPTNMPNRCSLKPLKPETPKNTLLLVLPLWRLTLQMVCHSRPRFRLPNPSSRIGWPTQAPVTASQMRLDNAPAPELLPGLSGSGNHPRSSKENHPNTSPDRRTAAYLLGLI